MSTAKMALIAAGLLTRLVVVVTDLMNSSYRLPTLAQVGVDPGPKGIDASGKLP